MVQIQLNTRSNVYLHDPNYQFLTALDHHQQEKQQVGVKEISGKVQRIRNKLRELDRADVEEWREIQQNKVRQLARRTYAERQQQQERGKAKLGVAIRALKQHLRILVYTCNQMELSYNRNEITQQLKQLYYDQYGQEIFPEFLKVGFTTHEFQTLSYSQPSFLHFCCCWQDID